MRNPFDFSEEELAEIERLKAYPQHSFQGTAVNTQCANCRGQRYASVHLVKPDGSAIYAW